MTRDWVEPLHRSFEHEAAEILKEWVDKRVEWAGLYGGGPSLDGPREILQRLQTLQEQIAEETSCSKCHTDAPKVCSICFDEPTVCSDCEDEAAVVCQQCR